MREMNAQSGAAVPEATVAAARAALLLGISVLLIGMIEKIDLTIMDLRPYQSIRDHESEPPGGRIIIGAKSSDARTVANESQCIAVQTEDRRNRRD